MKIKIAIFEIWYSQYAPISLPSIGGKSAARFNASLLINDKSPNRTI